jgi:hypothetical protein
VNGKALCLIYGESIAVFRKYNIASLYNPTVLAVDMINSLAENYKMRLNDFCSHSANIHVFETILH